MPSSKSRNMSQSDREAAAEAASKKMLTANQQKKLNAEMTPEKQVALSDLTSIAEEIRKHGDTIVKQKGFSYMYSPQELEEQLTNFFAFMADRNFPVTVYALASYLGLDHETLNYWERNPEHVNYALVKRAKAQINTLRAMYTDAGRINPTWSIAMFNNTAGWTQNVNIKAQAMQGTPEQTSPEEVAQIARQLEAAKVIEGNADIVIE